ncbi:MAG: hypothetical protein DRI57_19260 [Deltaproteobacteria bacterium]|nr:MAG: hypothetical protein DRI57_19260 [Deltaproteobacteria bacterium]
MKIMSKFNKYLWQSILLVFLLIFCSRAGYAESLYVFYPTTQRPRVINKKMTEVLPGIEITVFGRYRDFEKKIGTAPPDAILAKGPVVRQVAGYSIKLRGIRDGSADEPYMLLSVDEKVDPGNLAGEAVGVVGILGRKGMKKFVGSYFRPAPKLRRVLKIEDLLELLVFKMVKAVIIQDHYVSYFKKRSRLNFVVTPIPKMRTGIIALALKKEGDASLVVKAVKGMDNKVMLLLEIDKWE